MIEVEEDPYTVKPMPNSVTVKIALPKEWITKGGIHVVANVDKAFKEIKYYEAEVIAVGKNCPKDIKVGNVYLLDKFGGYKVTTEGEHLIKVVEHTLLLGEVKKNISSEYYPHFERLLIKETELGNKTDAGIIVPNKLSDAFHQDTLRGVVINKAPDVGDHINVGDTVIWEKHAGVTMQFEDGVFISIPKYCLIAKIEAPQ